MKHRYWLKGLLVLSIVCSPFSNPASAQTLSQRNVYLLHCSGCHGDDGAGSRTGGIPSLRLIKSFTSDADGRKYIMQVPGIVNSGLSNKDIAAVVNYVVTRWGQPGVPFQLFSEEEVNELRATEIDDIVAYRRNLTARYAAKGKLVADYPWP